MDVPQTSQCSRCGKPLSNRDEGLCPACLVQLGLDAAGRDDDRHPAAGGW